MNAAGIPPDEKACGVTGQCDRTQNRCSSDRKSHGY
jgi:hypothetical protein